MNKLVVTINPQIGGYNFSLSPKMIKELALLFPNANQLPHLFVSYHTKVDFETIYDRLEMHLLPILTGVDMETLGQKIKYVEFVNPNEKNPSLVIDLSNEKQKQVVPG